MKRRVLSLIMLLSAATLMAQQPKAINVSLMAPRIDSIAQFGIDSGCYPGCQILVSQNGKIIFNKAYGRQSAMGKRKVKTSDLYDLASITKSAAVALGIMKLYDDGLLRIEDRASKYLTWMQGSDKENMTIEELLFHTSGTIGWIEFYHKAIDPASVKQPLVQSEQDDDHPGQIGEHKFMSRFKFKKDAVRKHRDRTHNLHVCRNLWLHDSYIDTLKQDIVRSPLGERKYSYTDVGYDLLVWIIEAAAGEPITDYLERNFYAPMGVRHTMFLPRTRFKRRDIVPTIHRDWLRGGKEIRGFSEDDMVAFMGGIGGGAGLFSNAEDLARIFQMLLNMGELDGHRYLKPETVRLFLTHTSPLSPRLMGFGRPQPNDVGNRRPFSAFGHGGVTGTDVWADPDNQIIYVYLTNRFSPVRWNDKYMDLRIQHKFQAAIYDSMK